MQRKKAAHSPAYVPEAATLPLGPACSTQQGLPHAAVCRNPRTQAIYAKQPSDFPPPSPTCQSACGPSHDPPFHILHL